MEDRYFGSIAMLPWWFSSEESCQGKLDYLFYDNTFDLCIVFYWEENMKISLHICCHWNMLFVNLTSFLSYPHITKGKKKSDHFRVSPNNIFKFIVFLSGRDFQILCIVVIHANADGPRCLWFPRPNMCRTDCIKPFYVRNPSMRGFWLLWQFWSQSPVDADRWL